jgi:hypothetical protein
MLYYQGLEGFLFVSAMGFRHGNAFCDLVRIGRQIAWMQNFNSHFLALICSTFDTLFVLWSGKYKLVLDYYRLS